MIRAVALAVAFLSGSAALAQPVSAILEPAELVEIRPTVAGRIDSLDVVEGALVENGGILARINADVQLARVTLARIVAEANAEATRAEIVVEQATQLRDRVAAARRKGAAQEWEVIQAEQAVKLAEADLAITRDTIQQRASQLALEEATLEQMFMRAPFTGTVLQVHMTSGEIADAQTTVMDFGRLDRLRATAFVPADWAGRLAQSQTLDVTVEGARVSATILNVDPRVDPASQSVRLLLEIENSDGSLRAGTAIMVEQP